MARSGKDRNGGGESVVIPEECLHCVKRARNACTVLKSFQEDCFVRRITEARGQTLDVRGIILNAKEKVRDGSEDRSGNEGY